ncbi:hypothetical protein BCR35DRAFT_265942 [Leucosporidium creatinivorum]|uniref:Proteophosphoglycan 5 n=1 Tax=Leucosporidium creatinivorum TaxID=106004 RepID=A0A1Y2FD59_9BASI|nr:hypothetical protein BCR35DRAFT_265942 [Leucosporidium creatinivorum]
MINLSSHLRSSPAQDIALSEPLLAADGEASPRAHGWGSTPSPFSLSHRLWTSLLALFALLAVVTSLYASQTPTYTLPKPKRVWLRSIEDNHSGLGSVVGQQRLAAAGARALGAELIMPTDRTGHGYGAADYLNRYKHLELDVSQVCVLSARPHLAATKTSAEAFVSSVMAFCRTGELSSELRALEECTLIIDDRPWEYRRDFGSCTMDWWDSIINVPAPSSKPFTRSKTSVAIHVRWGDTQSRLGFDSATHNATLRSTPLSVANPIINSLAACRSLDVHVYMEGGNSTLFPLNHPFTLHDGVGQDPLDDLRRIAEADVRISALGGFASLIHWSAKHGLSIVPSEIGQSPPLYTANKRIQVVYQGDVLSGKVGCETLEEALRIQ